jgi:hypothetical protein
MSKPAVVRNKRFPSQAAAARFYGITQKMLEARLKRGWTIEQALDLEPPEGHKRYNLWLRRTGKNERICSRCRVQKPLTEYYLKPDSATGTHGSQCRECVKLQVLESLRRRKYGLTPDQWNKLFKSQGSCCAICKTTDSEDRAWHTDHSHETGKTRGILCKNCNLTLGFAKDSTEILQSAVIYLKHSKGERNE